MKLSFQSHFHVNKEHFLQSLRNELQIEENYGVSVQDMGHKRFYRGKLYHSCPKHAARVISGENFRRVTLKC